MKGTRLFHTIQVKLIIMYVMLILIAMQLIGVYFISTLKNSLTSSFSDNLNEQVNMLTALVEGTLTSSLTETGETTEDRKSTRLNSSHIQKSRMPSSA